MGSGRARAPRWGDHTAVVVTLMVCVAVTLLVAGLPAFPFAVRSPALKVTADTLAACVTLGAGLLFWGRLRRRHLLEDLLLATAFVFLGTANATTSVLPLILVPGGGTTVTTWATVTGRALGALLFAAGAVVAERPVKLRHPGRWVVGAPMVTLAAVVGVLWAVREGLPPGVGLVDTTRVLTLPVLLAHPVLSGVQLVVFCLYVTAAIGFLRRAGRTRDQLAHWLAAASMVAATARVHLLLYPSLYSEYVYSGDVLRLAFNLLVVVGLVQEIRGYWRDLAEAAVLEERRRIARDLHDGVAQELAFIASEAERIPDRSEVTELKRAARRALDESRRAIAALSRKATEPIASALEAEVREVAGRYGVPVRMRAAVLEEPGLDVRETVLRVAREAAANAARHGAPERIDVRLVSDVRGVQLDVHDDGKGFDPEATRATSSGFGLTTMTERAEAVGGALQVTSASGEGTTVNLRLPLKTAS